MFQTVKYGNPNLELLSVNDLSNGNIHLLSGVTLFRFGIKQLLPGIISLCSGVTHLFRGVFPFCFGITPLLQRNILPFRGVFHSLRGIKLSRFGVKYSTDSDLFFDRNCKR